MYMIVSICLYMFVFKHVQNINIYESLSMTMKFPLMDLSFHFSFFHLDTNCRPCGNILA